ncbi:ROK family protein [Streptomyces bottropensis]|uniref:ROK family transcriptional regulator n=1 Tax=Streptomyces bottropensis TaxID=42235 RepID=UPI003799A04C
MTSYSPGGSLRTLRLSNAAAVLRTVAEAGPLHRAEIARRVELSRTTVTTITRELIEGGVLVESLDDNRGPEVDGRAGGHLMLTPTAAWAGGVNMTLDGVAARVHDLAGGELGTAQRELAPTDDGERRAELATEALDEALERADGHRDRLLAVGVGLPGQIDPSEGVVHGALDDQPWHGMNALDVMSNRLGVPVLVENNVRLETLAECRWGDARDVENLIYVHISSGLAIGIVIAGQLYRGADGGAGEFGHVSIDIEGPACRCGNRGCLVLKAGGSAVGRRLRDVLGDSAKLSDIVAASAAGNRAVRNVLRDVGGVVGRELASICNLLNPELVVVGGQTASAGDVLLEPLREGLVRHTLAPRGAPKVVPSLLPAGADAGAWGAVALVLASVHSSPTALERLLELGAASVERRARSS